MKFVAGLVLGLSLGYAASSIYWRERLDAMRALVVKANAQLVKATEAMDMATVLIRRQSALIEQLREVKP